MRRAVAVLAVSFLALWGCSDREVPKMADGRLAVFPGSLDFSMVALHDGRDLEISLRNVGRGQLGIDKAWIEGEGKVYQADFTHPGPHVVIPGGDCAMNVRFAPRVAGLANAVLVVQSDSHENRIFRLPLSGTGVDTRAIPEKRALDFGRIEVGTQKQLNLSFTNPSPLDTQVTIQVVGQDPGDFTAQGFTLGAGQSTTIPVLFKPGSVGSKNAALAVTPCKGCDVENIDLVGVGLDRAIVAEPPVVDFGQVAIDKTAVKYATLHNISTEPATVQSMQLDPASDPSFTAPPAALPVTLQPDERVRFELDYAPGHMGPATGTDIFTVVSQRHPTLPVGLTAWGGAAELCVSPQAWDFGNQPTGSKTALKINVKNCGSSDSPALTIQGLVGNSGDLDQFTLGDNKLPTTLKAGEQVNLVVYFEPTRAGGATATFELDSSVWPGKTYIQLGGEAQDHLPCQLAVTPTGLDFGTVLPGRGAVLGVKVKNVGTDLCPVKNIQLTNDGAGAYGMPGGEIAGLVIWPGDWFSFQVSFMAPQTPGQVQGNLQIEQNNAAQPVIDVPLVANSQDSCIVASPWYVDFGVARPDCPPKPRQVNLLNACGTPVSIGKVEIGPGTTDGEFTLADPNAYPVNLQPGESETVDVAYAAQVIGMNLAPLYVTAQGIDRPLLVPLIGESYNKDVTVDKFVQQNGQKVDVLFIVDNTRSMVEEQPRLESAIPTFVNTALARNVDLHVAVTTTGFEADPGNTCGGGANGAEAGRFFPVDNSQPRILTNATPNLATQLQKNADVGLCAENTEQGLEAMRRAISSPLVDHADDPITKLPNDGNLGFLRNDAALSVVIVSDEDDHSQDDVATYVQFLQSVKGIGQPQRAAIYAISPNDTGCASAGGTGTRYQDATKATGGEWLSICNTDYSPLLADIADKTFSPQANFPLTAIPDPTTIVVTIDGKQVDAGWGYDQTNNSIDFDTPPPGGATITVSYTRTCRVEG